MYQLNKSANVCALGTIKVQISLVFLSYVHVFAILFSIFTRLSFPILVKQGLKIVPGSAF